MCLPFRSSKLAVAFMVLNSLQTDCPQSPQLWKWQLRPLGFCSQPHVLPTVEGARHLHEEGGCRLGEPVVPAPPPRESWQTGGWGLTAEALGLWAGWEARPSPHGGCKCQAGTPWACQAGGRVGAQPGPCLTHAPSSQPIRDPRPCPSLVCAACRHPRHPAPLMALLLLDRPALL